MRSLEQLFAWAKNRTVEAFNNSGFHMPWFAIELPGGQVTCFATPWFDDHEKEAAIDSVRRACKKCKAQRVVMVHEGWLGEDGCEPSEVVMLNGQTCASGEHNLVGYFEIDRDAGGKATIGRFVELKGVKTVFSIFSDMTTGNAPH